MPFEDQINKIEEDINSVKQDIHSIREAITGNDYGNKGLINRMEVNEIKTEHNNRQIKEIKTKAGIIAGILAGAVIGIEKLVMKILGM